MNCGWTSPTLRDDTEDDLVFILTDEEYAILSGELNTSGPNVIARSVSNSIKDGHSLRSPSQPPNPLTPSRKGNSSASFSNYGK